jgi:hypothetical protein
VIFLTDASAASFETTPHRCASTRLDLFKRVMISVDSPDGDARRQRIRAFR